MSLPNPLNTFDSLSEVMSLMDYRLCVRPPKPLSHHSVYEPFLDHPFPLLILQQLPYCPRSSKSERKAERVAGEGAIVLYILMYRSFVRNKLTY